MGLSSSKSKTSTNQNQSATQTPVTPDWLLQGAQDYVQRIADFGDMDPNQFVAGASPLQQQAWANVARLGNWQGQAAEAARMAQQAGASGPNLAGKYPDPRAFIHSGAQGMAAPAPQPQVAAPPGGDDGGPPTLPGTGYSPAPSMPGYAQPRPGMPIGARPATPNPAITGAEQMGLYRNPWDRQVVDTTLAGFDQEAAQVRAAQEAAAARSGAFGGSRNAITRAMTEGQLAQARAAQEAQLRQAGFNNAAGFGMQDAAAGNRMLQFNAGQQDQAQQRALAAAALMSQQANDYDNNSRADLGVLSSLGGDQRAIEQAYAQAPLAQLGQIGALSGLTPYQILVGQQTDGNMSGTNVTTRSPSLFDQLLAAANMAARFL